MHLRLLRRLAPSVALILAMAIPAFGTAQTAQTAAAPELPAAPAGPATGAATPATTEVVALPEGVTPEVMAEGERLFFQNCRRCHGMRGTAGVPLSKNENIADPSSVAAMIIHGRGYMPPLGEHLSDEQIAAISTFARNSWGNTYGPVTPQDVEDMR